MRERSSIALLQPAELLANGAEQAATHFVHDGVCAAALLLMAPGAEVDRRSFGQLVRLAGRVAVHADPCTQKADAVAARLVRRWHGVIQQLLYFVACGRGRRGVA